jgi:hypothetical protein
MIYKSLAKSLCATLGMGAIVFICRAHWFHTGAKMFFQKRS